LKTGFVIKVTDQVTTRQLIYREISISKIDTSNNIVTGTAVANSWVSVAAKPTSGDTVGGGAVADKNGIWTFDFGYQNPVDAIQNGTRVIVSQYDDDYDAVDYEKMIMPRVEVALDSSSSGRVSVNTFGWANGSLVTLKVDNPSTNQSPDFTFTKTASWDTVYFSVYPPNGVLLPGDLVTVEGNNLSTSYKVKLLKVTKTDVVGDFIGGIADPNQKILLDLRLSGRTVTAETVSDSNGNWGVYFSSMMPPVDLVLGGAGKASVNDMNGNATTMNISL
jgi:hypothetical protein